MHACAGIAPRARILEARLVARQEGLAAIVNRFGEIGFTQPADEHPGLGKHSERDTEVFSSLPEWRGRHSAGADSTIDRRVGDEIDLAEVADPGQFDAQRPEVRPGAVGDADGEKQVRNSGKPPPGPSGDPGM